MTRFDLASARGPVVGAGLAFALGAAVLVLVNDTAGVPSGLRQRPVDIALAAAFAAFLVVGGLLDVQRPGHPIAWLLIAEGFVWELGLFCAGYVSRAVSGASLPAPGLAAWILAWIWVPGVIGIPLLLLLFPDGRPPSWRWRPVAWLAFAAGASLLVAAALEPGPLQDVASLENPIGVDGLDAIAAAGGMLLPAAMVGALASVVVRYRHAGALERRQLGWFAYAAALIGLSLLAAVVLGALGVPETVTSYLNVLPLAALPLAIGAALARRRLYDLDTLVDRTLLAAALAGFVTLVYVVVVVIAGNLVGGSSVLLATLATAIVAVAIAPLYVRLRRRTARLAYREPELQVEALSIKTLGGFCVFRAGEPVTAWPSKKSRTLLKILIARRGRPVTREQLMELLWPGDDPAKLGNRLSVALTTLRTVLGRDLEVIRSDADAVSLDLGLVAVDVERFLAEVELGLSGGDVARLVAAERLYAGEFLEEDAYEDWTLDLRDQARVAYSSSLRARARLASDDDEAVRAYLRLLEHDRWDAEAHRGLIARLDRAGRHGEATRRRQAYVRTMAEIGVQAGL